jgi:hypothetical protein
MVMAFYAAEDLAAATALNPYFKAFFGEWLLRCGVTPFFQTILNLENMPLVNQQARNNLAAGNYPSGHMIYLDDESRTAMKADLARFYDSIRVKPVAAEHLHRGEERGVLAAHPIERNVKGATKRSGRQIRGEAKRFRRVLNGIDNELKYSRRRSSTEPRGAFARDICNTGGLYLCGLSHSCKT